MAAMLSFIWFTVVVVGILVSSLAMISMGAACWDNCGAMPALAQYLVVTGSIFFCLLIMLLLLTFCICTSSGDPKITGPMKIVYGVSISVMYILIVGGSTLMFTQSSNHHFCNKTNSINEEFYRQLFNSTGAPPSEENDFCIDGLRVFSYCVLVIFHMLLFFSLLVTFYNDPSGK